MAYIKDTANMAVERLARRIMRRSLTASLATLEPKTGDPGASLVATGLDMAGRPVLLTSDLARHTHNFKHDARAAVLFDDAVDRAAPLECGRVSLKGHLSAIEDEAITERYLRAQEDARNFAGFGDFAFYILEPEEAYFVGGFGKIHTITANALLLAGSIVNELARAEVDVLEHMNQDHSDAVQLIAKLVGGSAQDNWRMTAIDPEGVNVRASGAHLRLEFEHPLETVANARTVLTDLAKQARATGI